VRLAHYPVDVGLGPAGSLNPANLRIPAPSPLVVFFDPPGKQLLEPTSPSTEGCLATWLLAAPRQLEVTYSLEPSERSHPEWTSSIRRQVMNGQVTVGMTHAMVAWSLGFPSQYGTRAELLHAPLWRYPGPAGGGSTVYFRDDRVVRYDPARQLP
jgi:hypothetical protein